jgi:hypothetical protein
MARFKTYSIKTRQLVALAFAAQRANGALHKDATYFDTEKDAIVEVTPNKVLMRDSFAIEPGSNPELVVSEQDLEDADTAMAAIQQEVMLKRLSDQRVNEFMATLADKVTEPECDSRDCGLIAFVPTTYRRLVETQSKKEATVMLSANSQYLGTVGNKVELDFVMIDNRFMMQYNCYSVNGHDGQGNLVNFLTAHKELATSGRIKGKIKRTETSRWHNNACVTQLNFVKVA